MFGSDKMPANSNELLSVLAELQSHYPHWRFGQLVSNVASWAGDDRPGEIGEVTDEQLYKAAVAHLNRLRDQESPQRAVI